MRDLIHLRRGGRARCAVAALAVVLAFAWGCGLEKDANPDLVGPSDVGAAVDLIAAPDTLNADGVSQSVVRLVLRDNTGQPIPNRSVLFLHNGDGILMPSTASHYVGPVQSGIVMATDRDGVAYVVYAAGNGIGTVTISVRPYGLDTAYTFFRSIEILQL